MENIGAVVLGINKKCGGEGGGVQESETETESTSDRVAVWI